MVTTTFEAEAIACYEAVLMGKEMGFCLMRCLGMPHTSRNWKDQESPTEMKSQIAETEGVERPFIRIVFFSLRPYPY